MKLISLILVGLCSAMSLYSKDYKGAEIYSKESVLYGRFEMRMQACTGSGILSTFFLYKGGSEQAGTFWEEIDIEIFGKNNAKGFQSNIITDGLTGGLKMAEEKHNYSFSLADTFHIYALEWTPDYVAWFFDGVEVRRDSTPQVKTLVNPESYRFNTWVSNSASWAGSFNPSVLPQKQYVDWLKYYSYNENSDTVFQLKWVDNFDTFDTKRWSKATWTFSSNLVDFSANNVTIENGVLVLDLTDERPVSAKDQLSESSAAVVYPNPATNRLFINRPEQFDAESVSIFNSQGERVYHEVITPSTESIDITALHQGIYYLKLTGKTNETALRFIKSK
jgi:beta-glucanase (GH16 family)